MTQLWLIIDIFASLLTITLSHYAQANSGYNVPAVQHRATSYWSGNVVQRPCKRPCDLSKCPTQVCPPKEQCQIPALPPPPPPPVCPLAPPQPPCPPPCQPIVCPQIPPPAPCPQPNCPPAPPAPYVACPTLSAPIPCPVVRCPPVQPPPPPRPCPAPPAPIACPDVACEPQRPCPSSYCPRIPEPGPCPPAPPVRCPVPPPPPPCPTPMCVTPPPQPCPVQTCPLPPPRETCPTLPPLPSPPPPPICPTYEPPPCPAAPPCKNSYRARVNCNGGRGNGKCHSNRGCTMGSASYHMPCRTMKSYRGRYTRSSENVFLSELIDGNRNALCNNIKLQHIIKREITDDIVASKALIQKATLRLLALKFNVLCATGEFSVAANSDIYCQVTQNNVTCLAFSS